MASRRFPACPFITWLVVAACIAVSTAAILRAGICPFAPGGTSEPDGTTQFALLVTPKGTAVTQAWYTSGLTASFTVKNNGTCTDSVNVTASANGALAVVSVSPSYFGLQPGASTTVWVTYNARFRGNGTLTLTATGSGNSDNGTYNVTVVLPYAVAVTPGGASAATRAVNQSYSDTFTVQNTGYYTDTYNVITCTGYVNVTCTSATPGSFTLNSGASQKVAGSYTVAGAGTGRLGLAASSAHTSGGGWYMVPVTAVSGAPLVDQTPYNYAHQDYGRCAMTCFAAVYTQSTVPYFSFDTPRSVALAYNSDRVNPRPFVHINVTPDLRYAQRPTEYRLQVKVNGVTIPQARIDATSRRRAPSTNGSSTTRITTARREAAARATSNSCSRTRRWAASVRT